MDFMFAALKQVTMSESKMIAYVRSRSLVCTTVKMQNSQTAIERSEKRNAHKHKSTNANMSPALFIFRPVFCLCVCVRDKSAAVSVSLHIGNGRKMTSRLSISRRKTTFFVMKIREAKIILFNAFACHSFRSFIFVPLLVAFTSFPFNSNYFFSMFMISRKNR